MSITHLQLLNPRRKHRFVIWFDILKSRGSLPFGRRASLGSRENGFMRLDDPHKLQYRSVSILEMSTPKPPI